MTYILHQHQSVTEFGANQDSVTITLEPSASKHGMIDKLINQQLGQLHNSLAGTVGIVQQETRMTNKETLRKKR